MTLTLILLCLFIQRLGIDQKLLKYFSARYPFFFPVYLKWFKTEPIVRNSRVTFFLLIFPLPLLFLLIATIVYHLFGAIGYYLIALCFLWHALDLRFNRVPDIMPAENLMGYLSQTYERTFAAFFWYLVLGVFGLVLYSILCYIQQAATRGKTKLLFPEHWVNITLQILDWLPIRLTGLTFALVGNFYPTFQKWYHSLFSAQATQIEHLLLLAETASAHTDTHPFDPHLSSALAINKLIHRSGCVWLAALTLFTIGSWIG